MSDLRLPHRCEVILMLLCSSWLLSGFDVVLILLHNAVRSIHLIEAVDQSESQAIEIKYCCFLTIFGKARAFTGPPFSAFTGQRTVPRGQFFILGCRCRELRALRMLLSDQGHVASIEGGGHTLLSDHSSGSGCWSECQSDLVSNGACQSKGPSVQMLGKGILGLLEQHPDPFSWGKCF